VAEKRIKWGAGREQAFLDWITQEVQQAETARAPLERRWRDWMEQYRAPANQPLKHFPWEGAANYVMPVTAIDVDQLYAKFIQTIHAPANLWTLEASDPALIELAKPLQDFLQWLDHNILHMEDVNKRAFLEMVKFGTCLYKVDWVFEFREVTTYDESGKRVTTTKLISQPRVDHVRLTDFLMPAYSYAIQPDDQGGAPWVAEKHRIRLAKLDSIADASEPYLPNYGKLALQTIRDSLAPRQSEHDDKIQHLDFQGTGTGPRNGEPFEKTVGDATNHAPSGMGNQPLDEVEIREVHARFPTTREGGPEDDIVVEVHLPTRTILRGTYLRYHHGRRPYEVARYFPSEGFYGIGVCEQKETFQSLESDLANYTHDNVLLGNATCVAAKQGANVAPGEPWYPGKTLITDGDPKQEIFPFQLGAGAYPGLNQLRDSYSYLGRQRTGVSDLNSGNIQNIPSRTPATTVQSLLEEGARRPDLTLKDVRRCHSEIGKRILQLMTQHADPKQQAEGDKIITYSLDVLGIEAGTIVSKHFLLPGPDIVGGLGVNLTATSATANKEVAKQAFMGLIQLKTSTIPVYQQGMQMALQFQGTPLGQVALDNLQAMAFLEKRLYEQFDIRNIGEVVPTIPKDPVQAISDPLAALQLLPGGGQGLGGPPQAPPMGEAAGPPGAGGAI
jgi:hypothetical protein